MLEPCSDQDDSRIKTHKQNYKWRGDWDQEPRKESPFCINFYFWPNGAVSHRDAFFGILFMSTVEAMIILGDAKQMGLADNSIDAIVTDPPYGLEFMGKEWDKLVAQPRGRTATMRISKPTIEDANDTPHHRMAVRQPAYLLRCSKCGGNSSGAWNRCQCEIPEFKSRSDLAMGMQEWHYSWATEALRVLKPGGHLLAMGGTRTFHRLTCALEDAGFEIRDCIMHLYGQGFPKSYNISKGFDRRAFKAWLDTVELDCCLVRDLHARKGQARKAVSAAVNGLRGTINDPDYSNPAKAPAKAIYSDPPGTNRRDGYNTPDMGSRLLASLLSRFWEPLNEIERHEIWQAIIGDHGGCDVGMPPGVRVKLGIKQNTYDGAKRDPTKHKSPAELSNIGKWGLDETPHGMATTAPSTPLAKEFEGFGSGLKPSFEPVVVARKPLIGTLCENAEKWGTGGLNIDRCRVHIAQSDTSGIWGDSQYLEQHKTQPGSGKTMGRGWHKPGAYRHSQGRWPANILLSHSEDCVRVGTKRVKGDKRNGSITPSPARSWKNQSIAGIAHQGHADSDGYEQVEDWICVESCPVRLLGDSARYFKNIDPGQETRVDNSVFLWYNKEKQEVNQCYENVNIAIRNSMPEKQMSSEDSGDSAGGPADTQAGESGARLTRGLTFLTRIGGDIDAGAKLEAGSNSANLKAAGCGNGNMARSPKDMKSTIEMATIPTTPLRTCNLWPRVGMTTIISDCGKIIEISQELNIADASGAKNTNHLPASTQEARGHTPDTARIVAANICENGVTATGSMSIPTKENMPDNERLCASATRPKVLGLKEPVRAQ